PEAAEPMLGEMADNLRARGIRVETGRFGADMEVSLLNDGPVTLLLDSRKGF
ncbi:MAG: D-aminoacyl-tRNA deacylase, partial [Christensenellaceae bacterium]|nr:D-aminoacyl-tRNA deacylase [Christensenellaceae bacterium]